MTGDFQGVHPVNILRGILPVASGWDTDPTSLENCTDGDLSTSTGTGTTTQAGAGNLGSITFDLGSIKTVLMGARVGMWTDASTLLIYLESSDDNSTWILGSAEYESSASATEVLRETGLKVLTGRYIRARFKVNAAATGNAKIYEVMAWELMI